ncbi:oocyte zinc finger protein XlCOF6-like [Mytilus californianus]|uniref:oocyte zinc finger protein XlCOF6-like n=1 Tax=Mytilus californianus TaxID=6549 RepID=UPI002245877B|nr:oocyte zinc finger protein XlCOF6-like [Mytilus californianus]
MENIQQTQLEMQQKETEPDFLSQINESSNNQDQNTLIRTQGIKKCQCKICKNFYFSEYSLKIHLKRMHTENLVHTCRTCGKNFNQRYNLFIHMKYHYSQIPRPFACKECDKNFTSKHRLFVHQQTHSIDKFTCSICGKQFLTTESRSAHYRRHVKEKRHACEVCGHKFLSPSELDAHSIKHEKQVFECSLCNKKYSTHKLLERHEKIHTGNYDRPVTCHLCHKFFFRLSVLKRHIKEVHSNTTYSCDICGSKTKSEKNLKLHHKRIHSGEKKFDCTICGKKFNLKNCLDDHFKRCHTDPANVKYPYTCQICKKGFFVKAIYEGHLNTHFGKRPFSCQYCPKSYCNIYYLNVHTKRNHSGREGSKPKPFECEFCGKMFVNKSQRKEHIRKHTGYYCPFICSICGKSLKSKLSYKTHQNTHLRPFHCGICQARYSSNKALVKHMKSHELPLPCVKAEEENTCQSARSLGSEEHSHSLNQLQNVPTVQPNIPVNTKIDGQKLTESSISNVKSGLTSLTLPDPTVKTEVEQPSRNIPIDIHHEGASNLYSTTSNVLMLNKIGSFKVSAESLKEILSGKQVLSLVKSEDTIKKENQ